MDCLNETKIHEYIDGSLTTVEHAMVRDHLIVCEKCRNRYEFYEKLEKNLLEPVYLTPPSIIEKNVLKELFPRVPGYASIVAFIAASFLLLVVGMYVYFDFANNSLVQAFQLTSHNTTLWIGSLIRTISSIFAGVYAVFKAINRFFEIIFQVNIGVEIIALSLLAMMTLSYYSISRFVLNKIKGKS